jgi:putative transposase
MIQYVGTVLRYQYRLRPGAKAERALISEWHRTRWLWNQSVAMLRTTGTWVRDSDLTAWRREHEWLRAGSSVVQQQELRNFRAKRAEGKGRRKFKSSRRTMPSLNYTRCGFSLKDGRLRLAGGLSIPVVWSRDLPSEPTSVRVYRDSLGHWYASFVVRRNDEPMADSDAAIGIDWGVKTIATTTDPAYDLPHPQYARKAAKALAKYQRRMARRKPERGKAGSVGYRKAKQDAAKVAKKVVRQRQDTARKWAVSVVRDHGALAVEDFKPSFLAKTRMARKAQDAAIGVAKRILIEHAERAGRKVVLVPPAYTTMTCSNCGARAKQRLELAKREFVCHACGLVSDRDRNAARAILARAGLNPAAADAVRHPSPFRGKGAGRGGNPRALAVGRMSKRKGGTDDDEQT